MATGFFIEEIVENTLWAIDMITRAARGAERANIGNVGLVENINLESMTFDGTKYRAVLSGRLRPTPPQAYMPGTPILVIFEIGGGSGGVACKDWGDAFTVEVTFSQPATKGRVEVQYTCQGLAVFPPVPKIGKAVIRYDFEIPATALTDAKRAYEALQVRGLVEKANALKKEAEDALKQLTQLANKWDEDDMPTCVLLPLITDAYNRYVEAAEAWAEAHRAAIAAIAEKLPTIKPPKQMPGLPTVLPPEEWEKKRPREKLAAKIAQLEAEMKYRLQEAERRMPQLKDYVDELKATLSEILAELQADLLALARQAAKYKSQGDDAGFAATLAEMKARVEAARNKWATEVRRVKDRYLDTLQQIQTNIREYQQAKAEHDYLTCASASPQTVESVIKHAESITRATGVTPV